MLIISLEEWNVSSVVHRNLLELEVIPMEEEVMVEEIHTEEDVIPTEEDASPIVDAVEAEVLVADDSDLVLAVVGPFHACPEGWVCTPASTIFDAFALRVEGRRHKAQFGPVSAEPAG